MKVQRENELQVVRLEEINKQLKEDLEDQKNMAKELEQKLVSYYSEEQYR